MSEKPYIDSSMEGAVDLLGAHTEAWSESPFDAPDAPDLAYVDAPDTLRAPMSLEDEIAAAIDFEYPYDDGVDEAPAPPERTAPLESWRVRVRNGVEYRFADETSLRRFALKGAMSANDVVSRDGGLTWVVAWQLGMGTDDFGNLFDFTATQPTIIAAPKPPLVHWPRVGAIALVLSVATALSLRAASVETSTSTGVFRSPLPEWYDAALGSVAEAPRPHMALPPRPQPVAPPAASTGEQKELAVRRSTAADHASVAKDALRRGAWEEAAIAYRKALQLDPHNGSYRIGLGVAAQHLLASAQAAQAAADAPIPPFSDVK